MQRFAVPGYAGYFADKQGNLWSKKHRCGETREWRKLVAKIHLCGPSKIPYFRVRVMVGGKRQWRLLHRLVAMAFHGEPTGRQQARHKDGNSLNNKPKNLLWGTAKENHGDMIRHGRKPRGEACAAAKLTASDVKEIFARRSKGETMLKIAKRLNVTRQCVGRILRKETWSYDNPG